MDEQNYNNQNSWDNQNGQSGPNGQFSQSGINNDQNPYSQNSYYQDYAGQGQDQNYGNAQYQGQNYGNSQYQYQGQNPYFQNFEPKKSANTVSIIGMIFGIISIPVSCCVFYNLIFCIPGLICSIIGYRQTKSGVSLAGIICSIIGAVITLIMIVLYIIGLSVLRGGYYHNYFY